MLMTFSYPTTQIILIKNFNSKKSVLNLQNRHLLIFLEKFLLKHQISSRFKLKFVLYLKELFNKQDNFRQNIYKLTTYTYHCYYDWQLYKFASHNVMSQSSETLSNFTVITENYIAHGLQYQKEILTFQLHNARTQYTNLKQAEIAPCDSYGYI